MSKRTTRKNSHSSSSLLNRIIWLTFFLFLLVGMFGLGTVYLRHETAVLANQNKNLYAGITEHKRSIAELGAALARATTRDELKKMIAEHELGLYQPHERQVVHVLEDPLKGLYEKQSPGLLTASSF